MSIAYLHLVRVAVIGCERNPPCLVPSWTDLGCAGGVLGRDPRLADIEDLIPQLTKPEWDMFVSQIRGFVQQKRKSQ